MITYKFLATSLVALAMTSIVGCVQYPTERQSVVDLRPQMSFQFDSANVQLNDARVLVDGLDAGRMGDFVDGKGSLRVLPGTHTVQVVSGTSVLFSERAYLGDGVARPFIVK
ncbi:MAG: hypothetical protein KA740_14430 [Rhodoferax sp.]|nr:hypothetical protein [Rhodoferax sp.]